MSAINAFCPVGIGGTKGIDVSSLKVFVGGLSPDQSSKDLYDVFSPFGTIRESVVIPDRFRVTFKDEESVNRVFDELPIIAPNGQKLSVVLAASNTKPRRAHFSVKHGTSGHKALPTVREEEESMMEPSHFMQSNHGDKTKKVSVYSDPSLYRTANIQPIAPAKLHIDDTETGNRVDTQWPNEDIKRDYQNLKRVTMNNENDDPNLPKSWRSMPVQIDCGKSHRFSRPQLYGTTNAPKLEPKENEYQFVENDFVDKYTKSEENDIPCTGSDIGDEDKERGGMISLDEMSLVDDLESVIVDKVVNEVEQEMQYLSMKPNTVPQCTGDIGRSFDTTTMRKQTRIQNVVPGPALNQQQLAFYQVPYEMTYVVSPAPVPTQHVLTPGVGNNYMLNRTVFGQFANNQAAYRSPSIGM